MATGRTISAIFLLTDLDHKVNELCDQFQRRFMILVSNEGAKRIQKEYGKISNTRYGGLGLRWKNTKRRLYAQGEASQSPIFK
jgi:hypothetical protein